MWIRRTDLSRTPATFEWLFSSALPFERRIGTGSLYLFIWQGVGLRGDPSDAADSYLSRPLPFDGDWHHVTFSWTPEGGRITADGRTTSFQGSLRYPFMLLDEGRGKPPRTTDFASPEAFGRFLVGCNGRGESFAGLIDELTVWSAPIDDVLLYRLYSDGYARSHETPDYAKLVTEMSPNPYEGGIARLPGVPENLELVGRFAAEDIRAQAGFAHRGEIAFKKLGGRTYLEAGSRTFDRFACPLAFDPAYPIHVVEIDYPDDTDRNAEYVIHDVSNYTPYEDYRMQVGVASGREYPCTGRMLTHRVIYWTRDPESVFIAMTARPDAPAAVAEIRIYRVKDGKLPVARMSDAAPVDGWGRMFGQYWEDVAMAYSLAGSIYRTPVGATDTPERAVDQAQRLAALMKFSGQNLCAYPGVWYDGLIAEDGYNPRDHAPRFLSAFYEVFDREGLSFVPLMNQDACLSAGDLVTETSLTNGSLNASVLSVRADGSVRKPGLAGPTAWNIAHPKMQRHIEKQIDTLIEQGKGHPSFKGVGLHVKHLGLEWFGSLEGGYNDYCLAEFAKATGIAVPIAPDDPWRGKVAAEWIKANALDAWIDWRCHVVTVFWSRMAKRLAAVRPDLRLWVNNIADIDPILQGFRDPDHVRRMMREGGFDADRLVRAIPNLVLGQTYFSSDVRHFAPQMWYRTPENIRYLQTMHLAEGFWDFVKPAAYPLAHQHDRYFECSEGRTEPLPGPFREHCWRVSTLHPAGRNALAPYVQMLACQDILGLTKGGFLIGTYGTEEYISRFAQYFRALPAVKLQDAGGDGQVKVRRGRHGGKIYQYVVNVTGEESRRTVEFPRDMKDLVTGEGFSGKVELTLEPWEFRSFAAPEGR